VLVYAGVAPRAKQNQQRQRRWRSYAKKANEAAAAAAGDDDEEEEVSDATDVSASAPPSSSSSATTADTTDTVLEWQCPQCTYINDVAEIRCSMCSHARPSALKLASDSAQAVQLQLLTVARSFVHGC
jgi:rubrerythrin